MKMGSKTIYLNSITLLVLCMVNLACKKSKGVFTDPAPIQQPPVVIVPEAPPTLSAVKDMLVDKNASDETAALFYNLKKISKSNILFGHQDDTKRGYGWANEQQYPGVSRERSDVKEVTGAYPAVYGHDFLHIANFADGAWYDYEKQIAHDLTVDAYNRGGINTYAWHYANPVSKGGFYWNDSPVEAVSQINPGGSFNTTYKNSLKEVADFAKALIGADGKLIPVIFRPFHEFDGDWFWWGASHCTPDQYKALYQFTVTYLRDSLGVHNFLYAWSPDKNFTTQGQYLQRYPGDAYVDVVGTDNYGDVTSGSDPSIAAQKLKLVSDYAIAKKKVAALTETGLQNLSMTNWYTQKLLKILQYQNIDLAYVLVWANTTNAFWTPYPGHAAVGDFQQFKSSPYIIFNDKLPNVYKIQ
jgi:mannan endo-1,4-beta-mannosidase